MLRAFGGLWRAEGTKVRLKELEKVPAVGGWLVVVHLAADDQPDRERDCDQHDYSEPSHPAHDYCPPTGVVPSSAPASTRQRGTKPPYRSAQRTYNTLGSSGAPRIRQATRDATSQSILRLPCAPSCPARVVDKSDHYEQPAENEERPGGHAEHVVSSSRQMGCDIGRSRLWDVVSAGD